MSHSFLWGENKKKRKCWRFAFRGLTVPILEESACFCSGTCLTLCQRFITGSLFSLSWHLLSSERISGGKVCKKWEQQGVWVKMNRKADDGRWITPWRTYARGWLWGNSRAVSVSMRIPYLHIYLPLWASDTGILFSTVRQMTAFSTFFTICTFFTYSVSTDSCQNPSSGLCELQHEMTWIVHMKPLQSYEISWDIFESHVMSRMPNFQPGPHLRRPGKSEKPSGMGSVLQCVDCQSMSKHVDTNISVGFATPNLSTNTGTSKIVKHGRVKMRINKSKNLQKRETRGNKKRNRGTHKNRYSWYAKNRKHENKQWDNKNGFQKSKRLRICRPQSRTRTLF